MRRAAFAAKDVLLPREDHPRLFPGTPQERAPQLSFLWSAVRLLLVFLAAFVAVTLTHLTLLHLPYFWDEGGYYVPAALDFLHHASLIPTFTNAHPPLPNVVLGSLYALFGFHILVTRLTACAFAAAALTAVYTLGKRLLGTVAGVVLAMLTALYPIWFAQSSLAHADIFAASFTLAALTLYLASPDRIGNSGENFSPEARFFRNQAAVETNDRGAQPVVERPAPPRRSSSQIRLLLFTAALFSLSVLAKETAVVQPAALFALELVLAFQHRADPLRRRDHLRWAAALTVPIPVLVAWYAYHHAKTGFTFGNPEFLRYNATGNLTLAHVFYALRIRFIHLFWQRNLWLPLTLAIAALFLPSRTEASGPQSTTPDEDARGLQQADAANGASGLSQLSGPFLPPSVLRAIAVLVAANLLAFSVLGGALLTRYLLPVYPLLLLVCLALWRSRTEYWPLLAALTGAAFMSALWLNPQTFFAPEDNLTYRDMIVVQQQAIDYLNRHYPDATVLTAWPVAADLTRPELGYTTHTFRVDSLENFTSEQLTKAAQTPGQYDTALVFTTHYTTPAFRRFLLTHPHSWRSRHFAEDIDLTPTQIALKLGGTVVWESNRNGEWAAILRFPRSYNALARSPFWYR